MKRQLVTELLITKRLNLMQLKFQIWNWILFYLEANK